MEYKEGVGKEITNQDNSFEERNGKKMRQMLEMGSTEVCLFVFVCLRWRNTSIVTVMGKIQ